MQADTAPRLSLIPGFGVLLDKEVLDATRSKRFLIFTLIMTAIMLLVVAIAYVNVDHLRSDGARLTVIDPDQMDGLVATWAGFVGYLGALMVIASTVDAMPHERSLGISAWIVTKPVSRFAYLLAKAVGHAITAGLSVVIIPTTVFTVFSVLLFKDFPLAEVIAATLILLLEVAFISFLNVALGVPLKTVTPVAIASLAVWFAPNFLPAVRGLEWTFDVLPSYLPVLAILVAVDDPLESWAVTMPLCAFLFGAAAMLVAVAWFERQEL